MENELIRVLEKYQSVYDCYEVKFGVGSLDRCSEFFFDPIRPNISDVKRAIHKIEDAIIQNVRLDQMSEEEFAMIIF